MGSMFGQQAQRLAYLYHYTSAEKLSNILDLGEFCFGDARKTNDPRESRAWMFGMNRLRGEPDFAEDLHELNRKIDKLLRDGQQLACFSLDRSGDPDDAQYLRGYSRARSWAQYADNHRGACLVFDRQAFSHAVSSRLQPSGILREDQIEYVDVQASVVSDDSMLALRAGELASLGLHGIAQDWLESYWRELFFRKNTDWESEDEYRFLVLHNGQKIQVPLREALRAIVLGWDFPPAEMRVLGFRLRTISLDHIAVAQMRWHNGAPTTGTVDTSGRLRRMYGPNR